jgi:Uma2 family endonuclease
MESDYASAQERAIKEQFMSVTALPIQPQIRTAAAVPKEVIWRLSVDQYHEMIRAGILTEDDQIELLEGWLVTKRPKNPSHRISTRQTRKALEQIVPPGWYVDSQEPITLEDSEPEPDVVVVRGETRNYRDRHPGARDLALVVEVAEATLERDQEIKRRIYARAGIPFYWIINLVENRIEVYSDPAPGIDGADYQQRADYTSLDEVPVVIEGREIGRISAPELLP